MIDVHQRLELPSGRSATYYSVPQLETLGLGSGTEQFDLVLGALTRPGQTATLRIEHKDGRLGSVPLRVRIDTPIETAYVRAGGIMPYMLEQLAPVGSGVVGGVC